MRPILIITCIFLFAFSCSSQTSTFITINSGGTFSRVTVGPSGCTATTLNLCTNFTGSPLSIALDGNILYIVDNKGFLYKNTLTNTGTVGNCTKLGQFISKSTAIYGLTVGPGGLVYAASASNIEVYYPSSNTFGVLGTLPNSWAIGGDMLFYQGKLYEAVKLTNGTNALIQVDLNNVGNSTLYMNFNAGTSVFGFASVTVPCSNNQAYALSTVGSSTDIYAVDMTNKTQATTATCTLTFKVNDAASIAETQSATPPSNPLVTSPFNICKGDVINFPMPIVGSVKDTLRWYTQASGGSSYGLPTPKVDSSVLGTTTYYVSAFDTSTGCETPRQTMVVSVNPYPAIPTITPKDSVVICTGNNATLTSSASSGNQWNLSGAALSGATNTTYTTNIAGNYTVTVTTNKGCSKTSAITKVIVKDTLKSTTNLAICQSQLPYSWNGLTFNSAGTQTKTGLKTINGCDSSATLILSIATAKIDTLNLFDCDSVYYKGVWYSYPTTIYDTIKAIGGCDSVDLVVKITIENKTKTKDTLNFSSCSSITYKTKTYTSSTSFTDTTKSYRGCDSVYTLVNIVIANNAIKDTLVKLSSCNKVIYKNITYTSSTTFVDSIIKTANGSCDSIYHYAQITITPLSIKKDTTTLSNCKSITVNGITYTSSAVAKDTIRSKAGCDSVYRTINVNIITIPLQHDTLNYNDCKTVTYKNKTYTSSTIVYDTLKSRLGCDSIAHLVIIKIAKPAIINETFLQDCQQVFYNNKYYYSSTFISDTLKTYSHCDSIINSAYISIGSQAENAYIPVFYDSTLCILNTNYVNQITDSINLKPYINTVSNFHPQDVSNDNKSVYILENVLKPNATITSYNHFIYKINTTNNTIKKIALQNNIDSNTAVALKASADNSKLYTVKYWFNSSNSKYYRKICMYDTAGAFIDSSPIVNNGVKGFFATDNYNFDINKISGDVYVADSCKVYALNASLNTIKAAIPVSAYTSYKYPNILATHNGKYFFVHQKNDTSIKVYDANSFALIKTLYIKPDSTNNKNLFSNIIFNSNDSVIYYTSFNNKANSKKLCYTALDWLQDTVIFRHYFKDSTICNSTDYNLDITHDNSKLYLAFQVCGTPKRIGFVDNVKTKTITSIIKSNRKSNAWQTSGRFISYGFTTKKIATTNDTTTATDCKQIVVNGVAYTSNQVVRKDTTKSIGGCDSIYNFVKIIIQSSATKNDTITQTHCKQVIVNGIAYTSNQVVRKDTTKSIGGCDSIYNFVKIIIQPLTIAKDTITLTSCKQVVVNGIAYTSNQVVRKDTTKSIGGCDSIYNFVKIIIQPLTIAKDTITLKHCKQIVVNGITYSTTTIIPSDTLKNTQGCDSAYKFIKILIQPISVSYKNTYLTSCKSISYNGNLYSSSTIIKDTLHSSGGCDSVYNITTITITPITLTILPKYYSSCDSVLFKGIAYYNSTVITDTIKGNLGCDSVYVQNIINILAKPTVSFNNTSVYALANTPVTLKPITTNASDYNWSPKIYLNDATAEYPVCTPLKDTVYKLVVYSDSGCKDSSYIKVLVSKPITIPTAFSPNGDGINDKWEIEFLNTYPQNIVQIFDRGGQLLYSSFPGGYKAWNGKYNGKDVPIGVYYYIIKLAPSLSLMSGYVTILR